MWQNFSKKVIRKTTMFLSQKMVPKILVFWEWLFLGVFCHLGFWNRKKKFEICLIGTNHDLFQGRKKFFFYFVALPSSKIFIVMSENHFLTYFRENCWFFFNQILKKPKIWGTLIHNARTCSGKYRYRISSIRLQIWEKYQSFDIEHSFWSIGISDIEYKKKYWVPSSGDQYQIWAVKMPLIYYLHLLLSGTSL
jgi:hypothetical protein